MGIMGIMDATRDGSILFDYDKIIETYALGGTMTECAAKMHCSVDTVKKVLIIFL